MTKKIIVALLALLLVAMAAVAGAEPVQLTFAFDQGVGEPTLKLLEQFNATHENIQVNSYVLPQDTNNLHDDFVNKMIAGDTSIDVMALDVVFISEFASAGWLAELDETFPEEKLAAYIPGCIASGKWDGKLYAMPWFTNASMFFYRTDLLEEAGVTEVPTTYEGWIEVYEKLEGKVDYAFSYQGNSSEAMVCSWCEFVWNEGGEILDAEGKPVLNSEAVIAATERMAGYIGKYAPEGTTTYAETESQQVFQEGKALTCRTWSGTWNTFNNEAESSVAGKVGATNLPVAAEGMTPHACLGGLSVCINNAISDEQKAAALEFITWITSEETEKTMTLLSSQPPAVSAVYSDAEVLEAVPFYTDFFPIISNGKGRPASPYYAELSDAIQRNVHQALTGALPAADALNNAQVEVSAF